MSETHCRFRRCYLCGWQHVRRCQQSNRGGAYNTLNASQKIDKSYAVEAEGLTLVNGKLATNGVKTSWNSKGFRFGVVGFGAQFRPKSGSDAAGGGWQQHIRYG